ncbi:MAG: hypothetical protein V4484_14965 [Pseudomonadota bacterium]
MTRTILALAAVVLLAGCAPLKDSAMNTSVTLQPQRSVPIGVGATTMLRYDGAADSRCPPNVQCVWAGELAYKFTLTGAAGSESFGLTAAKPAFDASSVPGLHIALGVNPLPPVQPANTPLPPHPVTITISHQ